MPRTLRGMSADSRFTSAYLALVALCWDALERIDAQLPSAEVPVGDRLADQLALLRLELLQLQSRASGCAGRQLLSAAQLERIDELVARQLAWLDFEPACPVDIMRLRIEAAQNWLFEQARTRRRHDEPPHPLRRQR